MAYEVILPKLGQTVEESRIVEWMKAEGDEVQRGEVLFTIETDKAVLDVEATRKGYLRKIIGKAGESLPVLSVVALITKTADEPLDAPESAPSGAAAPVPVAAAAETVPAAAPAAIRPEGQRIFASPRARKTAGDLALDLAPISGTGPGGRIVERDVLAYAASAPKATPVAAFVAQQLGVDLHTVTGTGPQGKITKADVVTVSAQPQPVAPAPAPQPVVAPAPAPQAQPVTAPAAALSEVPLAGVRAIIAQRMYESHQSTAPVTLTMEVDATALVTLREQLKARLADELGFAIGYNDLLMAISARALRKFSYVNARLEGDVIKHLDAVHIGLAVDTERGLLVPNVKDVDRKGLAQIAREIRDLAARGRSGRLTLDELSGGTFTITNLGMYDVDAFTPIINYPETAILGVGRIKDVPAVVDGAIVARKRLWLSLTFDHRLVDGAPAARFLQYIKQLIEEPYLLLA